MKYPVILHVSERHQDDWFFICNGEEELLEASLHAFENLKDRLYEQQEPKKDRYPEVTDEYIENAPERVQRDLKDIQEKRERWLSETGWTNTYRQAKHFYDLYEGAKNGDGESAYHYLNHYNFVNVRTPTEI